MTPGNSSRKFEDAEDSSALNDMELYLDRVNRMILEDACPELRKIHSGHAPPLPKRPQA